RESDVLCDGVHQETDGEVSSRRFPRAAFSMQQKRGCEEMNPHFFTAPFYFAFIWFKVQGSRFRWRLRRLF
ncbi:MAG: hypothetical protein MR969_06125, partial [Dialister sp.]|nr:hypothetical protein [Dialister sp.]